MRKELEIHDLKQELESLTGFVAEFGTEQEFKNECVTYSCNICDALNWILEKTNTEHFLSDSYLHLDKLSSIVKQIEQKTGKKPTLNS